MNHLPIPTLAAAAQMAFDIADRAVIADIEGECSAHCADGHRWYDLRPMLDLHEHAGPVIDMAQQAVVYALLRGLVVADTKHPHLVRVVRRP
jgi:hypothetical protein